MPAHKNPVYYTDPGNDTKDKIFLLSCKEALEYLSEDGMRKCTFADDPDHEWWWLRSPGDGSGRAARVSDDGSLNSLGNLVLSARVVRPALWINLNADLSARTETAAQEQAQPAQEAPASAAQPAVSGSTAAGGEAEAFYAGIRDAWTNLKEADLDGVKRFADFALQRYGSAIAAAYMPESRSIGINFDPARRTGRKKSLFTLRLDKKVVALNILAYEGDARRRKVPYADMSSLLDEEKLWADSDRFVADNVTFLFGSWKGKSLEWLVLAKEPDRMLLLSKFALDNKKYDEGGGRCTLTTWEKCTLRQWLNGEFLRGAFSAEERERIILADVPAHANPKYDTDPGNDTKDKIFLLSCKEALEYLPKSGMRKCTFADDHEVHCWWWLRSPGSETFLAASVDGGVRGGSLDSLGRGVSFGGAVRPVLWINLES